MSVEINVPKLKI